MCYKLYLSSQTIQMDMVMLCPCTQQTTPLTLQNTKTKKFKHIYMIISTPCHYGAGYGVYFVINAIPCLCRTDIPEHDSHLNIHLLQTPHADPPWGYPLCGNSRIDLLLHISIH